VNVGPTTTGNSAKVPVVGAQAFFRVVAQSAGAGVITQSVQESVVRKSKMRAQKQRARR
jgi:hypothetical protein